MLWSVSIVLPLLLALASACDFPYFMQTNSSDRDWRTRVKQQYTQFPVTINVEKNVMRTISTDPDARSHTRVCLQNLGNEKYLVLHESSGQDGARYTCVQFLQRSAHIVQLQEAEISTRMDSSLCHDSNLTLNPWLVIDKKHMEETEPVPCSLQGGFSVRIYDSASYTGICDGYTGQTRMESECVRGEGLTFYFRQTTCIPENMYMSSTQHTECLANWSHGPASFMLLKHTRMQYMWVMRLPASLPESFVAFVFHDMVADASNQIARSFQYMRLDSVRDVPIPRTSLCVDDYELCRFYNKPCSTDELALTCPRTCHLCNSTRPALCTLNSQFMGQWYNAANPGTLALTVNTTFMTTYDGQGYQERFHCVDWESQPQKDKHTDTQMLVTEFNNGCKPRYSCVSFLQKASSILFMKLSEAKSWPFTATPTEPADCSNFAFKEDETLEPNMFKNDNFRLVYSRTSNSVPCDLPTGLTNYAAEFRDGTECTASLVNNQLVNSFTVMLEDCPAGVLDSSHTCVESSRVLTSSVLLIVTRSARNPDRIYCWVFPRGSHNDKFYLLDPSQCNESVRRRIRKDRVRALAVFSKTHKPGMQPPIDRPSTAFVSPGIAPTPSPPRAVPPTGTTRISVGDRVGDGPATSPGYHFPRDDNQWNDTALEGTAGEGDSAAAKAVPFVIMAAILFFVLFQIPCNCGS